MGVGGRTLDMYRLLSISLCSDSCFWWVGGKKGVKAEVFFFFFFWGGGGGGGARRGETMKRCFYTVGGKHTATNYLHH